MKILSILSTLSTLSTLFMFGCSPILKQGRCYFNDDYRKAVKVTKVMDHGAFMEILSRSPTVCLYKGPVDSEEAYVSWDVLERRLSFLREVDCEAYEKIKSVKNSK